MKQGEQLAAVAGSVKGRDDYKQTSEGWLAHYSSLFFFSAEDCVGCQGGQARAVAHLAAFPVCLLTLSSPDSVQPRQASWELSLTSTLSCQERPSIHPAFFLS